MRPILDSSFPLRKLRMMTLAGKNICIESVFKVPKVDRSIRTTLLCYYFHAFVSEHVFYCERQ
ncbi:hypothetical protein M378DRAFT_163832 [Amanita muscaria Koide BX008]|uniref:Uncharacterized protein n=1 Tax=Amanita muscaria (strain Koide BX008) TaxID=946122 RepID=A0A0C2SKZ1_AMAMK|nr:hypothetical protein M378DRAFT_163832 [Amanita muscaria Koide BX008]